jgi:hypothetical protein
MGDPKMCRGKFGALRARTSVGAVVGIVIAGAIFVIFTWTMAKGGRGDFDSSQAGKFVGIRHDATIISKTADTPLGIPTPAAGQDQEPSTDTVVQNGVTIVSPRLLVPVIDAELMQTASGSEDSASSPKASHARKSSRYAKRSHARRQSRIAANRWTAYGFAFR